MGDDTKIQWTDATWNPVRGCSKVSAGCANCYAERVAARFSGPGLSYEGIARGGRWTGDVRLVEEHISDPLRWTRPRRVFANSMSDLFHEGLSDRDIMAIFGVMAAARQHTFQVLTKRPTRMRSLLGSYGKAGDSVATSITLAETFRQALAPHLPRTSNPWQSNGRLPSWPLPNVWLGVSVEDQKTADERIPILLSTPAAVRFVSAEPLLGPVRLDWIPLEPGHTGTALEAGENHEGDGVVPGLDWVIVGGESGPGARPCDVAWVRAIVEQCRAAGVPAFVKQLGARPIAGAKPLPVPQSAESIMRHGEYDPDPDEWRLRDRKGGDPDEWPEDLRVRQFPETRA